MRRGGGITEPIEHAGSPPAPAPAPPESPDHMRHNKMSLGTMMVAVAYSAVFCAGWANTIHDPSRLDAFTGVIAMMVAGNIVPRLIHGQGRNLRAYRGFAFTNLAALASILVFYQLYHAQLPGISQPYRALALSWGLPSLAVIVGYAGAGLALRFS